jgi:hypothetical protein
MKMNEMPHVATQIVAEQYAATQGITVTARDRENIAKSQQAESRRDQAVKRESESDSRSGLFAALLTFYPPILSGLLGAGEVLITFTQTLIIAFGVPLVLVLLLIVEQQRVVHGILLFESDVGLASFAAWALVLLNLTLEFTIEYIESRTGYTASVPTRPSLRIWAHHAAYAVGLGRNWRIQNLSPAARYKNLLRLVTFTILALALAGSMRGVIEQVVGTWHEALVHILTGSSLSLMLTWTGGLLFAAAAVLAAQGLSRYVAVRCAEIAAKMQSSHDEGHDDHAEALDAVAVQYILAKVAAAQAKQSDKIASGVATAPVPFSTNGRER